METGFLKYIKVLNATTVKIGCNKKKGESYKAMKMLPKLNFIVL